MRPKFAKLALLMSFLAGAMPVVAQELWLSMAGTGLDRGTALHFPTRAVGYAVVSGQVLKTVDSGNTWTDAALVVGSAGLHAVRFQSATRGLLVGDNGAIQRTTNGGNSWVARASGTARVLRGVAFPAADTAFAVGDVGTIVRSIDGGLTWTAQPTGSPFNLYAIHMVDSRLGWAVGDGSEFNGTGPVVFKTTNAGENWVSQTPGVSHAHRGIQMWDPQYGVIATDEGITRTTNGGATWTYVPASQAGMSRVRSIAFADSLTLYAASPEYGIFKSTDGGFTWTRVTFTGITGSTGFNALQFFDLHNGLALSTGSNPFGPVPSYRHVYLAPPRPDRDQPVSGSMDVPLNVNLTFGGSSFASSYHLQVSANSGFSSLIFEDSELLSATTYLENLNTSTVYYARARAKNPGGTSEWSDVLSFTTVPPIPPSPILSAPVSGGTDIALSPALTWGATAGAVSYRVQVSTNPGFTALVKDTVQAGTSKTVGPLANNTLYYWRVSAINAGGASAYSTISTFTTIPVPAAPAPTAPGQGAVNVALAPALNWNPSTHAATYRVQLSTDPAFGTFVLNDSTVTGTSRAAGTLNASTTYHWRVNAKNGGTSAYSVVMSFTTLPPQPAVPAPSAPANAAIDIALSPTLSWAAAANAVTYRVQLSTHSDFTAPMVDDSTLTGTSLPVGPLTVGVTYHWRVNAKNPAGTSVWTTSRTFTTIPAAPVAPAHTAPANNATSVAVAGNLTWSAPAGAASYTAQLSRNPGFTDLVFDDSGITSATKAYGGLRYNATYYWRMRAKNSGGSSAFSGSWQFTTVALGVPVPTAPSQNAASVALSPSLTWNAVSAATSYHVQLSTDSLFASTTVNDTALGAATRAVGPLNAGAVYYWRVRARNLSGSEWSNGDWTALQRFTVMAVPAVPALASPGADSTGVPTSPSLVWQSVSGAATYRVQLAADSLFTSLLVNDSTLTATTRAVGPLGHATVHYWRVNAKNGAGTSAFSAFRKFTTTPVPVPVLTAPTANNAGVALISTFSWNAVSAATGYTLQVSTDSTFAITTVNEALAAVTTRSVGPLASGTTYFWRLRALNGSSASGWSELRRFATLTPPAIPVVAAPVTDTQLTAPASPTLSWQASAGADTYRLQVSTDSTFATFAVNDSTLTALTRAVGPLTAATYYWRVNAKNGGGTSGFSPVRRLVVQPAVGLARARFERAPGAAGFLAFDLSIADHVRVSMYDAKGILTLKLLDARLQPGAHRVPLPRRAREGGYYLLEFRAGEYRQILKLSALP